MQLIIARKVLVFLLIFVGSVAQAAEVPLTILHTNDIHSHFRPDTGPYGLGGVARLATAIRRIRESVPQSLLLDGGDFSEGHIYYNLGAGRASIEMMNTLGFDAVVVGNHDWLNGPDHLLKIFKQVPPKFALLSANLDTSDYARAIDFEKNVQPFQVLRAGPLKVGVIGISTYEQIYDKFFLPIKINEPFVITRKLAARLKTEEKVDLVVVISHNGLAINRLLAGLPNVDVVIHAHDHLKLAQPITVERNGKKAILVETGCWGQYLGRLDLAIDSESKQVSVKNYELIQIDSTIPDDVTVSAAVNLYDTEVTYKYGDIFHDHLADLEIDLRRESKENLLGNMITDAYRDTTGADVAFEQVNLTSTNLWKGVIHSVDVFNMIPPIYSPITDKAWTLKTMKMSGASLAWLMNLVVTIQGVIPGGLVSVSGMHAVYDSVAAEAAARAGVQGDADLADESRRPLKRIEIGGKPLVKDRYYLVASSQGLIEALEFIDSLQKDERNKIDRHDLIDTGVESWRAIAAYLKKNSPFDSSKVSRGGRLALLQADVALYHDDVVAVRNGDLVDASVVVRNLGNTQSEPRTISFTYDLTPEDTVDDPNLAPDQHFYDVPPIPAGGTTSVKMSLKLPPKIKKGKLPLYFRISGSKDDPNGSNNGTWLVLQ